jgi:hypothetical protein
MSAPIVAPPPSAEELLAQYGNDVVWLQNTQPGPTVFSADTKTSDGYITWQGMGNANGEDVMPVPKTLLSSVQLQANIRRGIFQIVDDPTVQQVKLEAQQAAWNAQVERRNNVDVDSVFSETGERITPVIEAAADNDMHVLDCLMKPQGCGGRVSLRKNELLVKPPLCPHHIGFAAQFIAQEDFSAPLVGGKAPMKWVRRTFG